MIGSKLKIVHVFRAPLGGLFRHVIDLATEQAARGHEVGLFFDAGGRDARVEATIAGIPDGLKLGVGVAPIARRPGPGDLLSVARFRGWLSGLDPDVIHGHGAKGGLLARLAGRSGAARRIVAYTPHGGSLNFLSGSWRHWLFMRVEAELARSTELFLFESDYIADRFDADFPDDGAIRRRAYNGLRSYEFAEVAIEPDAADILYVGELRHAKGVDTLIDALAILGRRGSGATMALVGSGPDRKAFERRARDSGLDARVRFLGPMPARKAFGLGRILVVPSRQESLPYIVLEAAAARKPMVATSVGGVPEIFGPLSDRLIRPDDPEILADAIAAKMAASARERDSEESALEAYVAGKFSISGLADAVLAGYFDALARPRPFRANAAARLRPHA